MKKRSHHNVVYNLSYHLVLVTKYRHKCISPEIFDFLQELFIKKFESEDNLQAYESAYLKLVESQSTHVRLHQNYGSDLRQEYI